MKVDFLIIGQGLAGTLLGWELMKSHQQVLFIDATHFQKSSFVAAGLINPVVFRRLTKSWLVDDLYPQMTETYSEIEKLLQKKVFYPLKIQKVFGESEDLYWQKKSKENQLENYLSVFPDYSSQSSLNLPHGSGWVEKGGRVDLQTMLLAFSRYLQENELLIEEAFDFDLLEVLSVGIRYKEIEARKIIFCEGHRVSQNPFFKSVDFRHTKGEVLNLEISNYQSEHILNKSFFLMPLGEKQFRLGATFDWNNLDETPTEKGENELKTKLDQVFTGTHQVTGHQAGIRPTAHDRRPVIGLHPNHESVGIFNGLGSKGCLIGPYFAKQFSDYLTNTIEKLHPEVDLNRYFRRK